MKKLFDVPDSYKEHIAMFDIIDAFFDKVKSDVVEFLKKEGEKSDLAVDLLMIAKYLERIGDHATNIAEWVLFSIMGKHAES